MFKFKITPDRHNAGLKFNGCLPFDLPNFSLPSTFKVRSQIHCLGRNLCMVIRNYFQMKKSETEKKTIFLSLNRRHETNVDDSRMRRKAWIRNRRGEISSLDSGWDDSALRKRLLI
jgi:hypothetical protein